MTAQTKLIIQMTAVGGLVVGAAAMAISRVCSFTATGEEGLQAWFYDQSAGELYAVPRATIAPHEGIGGQKGDGVRAVVVAAAGECGDGAKRRIAYLETSTPECKQLMEGIRAARKAGRAYGQPIPDAESGYYEKHTLVRRVDDPKWHDMTTPEARRIVSEWRGRRGPDQAALTVCTP